MPQSWIKKKQEVSGTGQGQGRERDDIRSRSAKRTDRLTSFLYFLKNSFPLKIFIVMTIHWKSQQRFILMVGMGTFLGLEGL